jgi:protein gp37
MGTSTKIPWTDATWNPVTGCTPISRGCDHCYARRMARRLAGRAGYPEGDGFAVTLHDDRLDEPLNWRTPRRVFVCSMGDLFHEDVPDRVIEDIFGVMALTPHLTYQVLTKRPVRMAEWIRTHSHGECVAGVVDRLADFGQHPHRFSRQVEQIDAGWPWPLPNVWLGVTAEDQERADERIPLLLQTPARVRFVSCEPLLGPVNLQRWLRLYGHDGPPCCTERLGWHRLGEHKTAKPDLDWVIAGGESGSGARPMHPDWARSLRDQCAAAEVPFFFKQWGEWLPDSEAHARGLANGHHDPSIFKAPFGTLGTDDQWKPDTYSQLYAKVMPSPECMYRVGTKRAGDLLDGKQHKEFPE